MADFVNNQRLGGPGEWTDITGNFAGLSVAIQNLSSQDILVSFGPTAPSGADSGMMRLPSGNWPVLFGDVDSRLWASGPEDGLVHVSAT